MKGLSLLPMVKKEALHILRDRQSFFMVLLMPVLMLLLYGYAINLDMRNIDMVISDRALSTQSREVIARFRATDFFTVEVIPGPLENIGAYFQSRKAQCVLLIPPDMDSMELVVDAGDPNSANFIRSYVSQVLNYNVPTEMLLFQVEPRIFYNPEMRSAPFFVPGLIALILLLITTLLTSIAIVREKEVGTMEQLLVSPVLPIQIILGKALPYTLMGFFNGMTILLVGRVLFKVPMEGSLFLVMLMMLLYVGTGLSLGMLISTLARTQAVAMLATVVITVLPSMLMSGFIFPIASMPRAFQLFSHIVPATYFLEIIRGIVLKGNRLEELLKPAAILLFMNLLLLSASIRAFRVRMD